MKLFTVQRDVMSGQCVGSPLRVQVGYTAVFLFPGLIGTWTGTKIGLFTPRRPAPGQPYTRSGFYFYPWLASRVSIHRLPKWYRVLTNALSFERRSK